MFELAKHASEIEKQKAQEWQEDHQWEDVDFSDGISWDEGLAIMNELSWARRLLDGISVTDVIDFASWTVEKIGNIDVGDNKLDLTDGVQADEMFTKSFTNKIQKLVKIQMIFFASKFK